AGLPPAPSIYSPLENLDLAARRRDIVLERMVNAGYITPAEAVAAAAEPLAINQSPPKYVTSPTPYFTTYVRKELARYIDPDLIALGGLEVETTINLDWQASAQKALNEVVEADGYYEYFDQAAATVIDVPTGEVRVMVGGTDFQASEFNRVTQAQRQPGSTFKTLVYATAIESGLSPYKMYLDAPMTIGKYKPKNYGGNFRGSISMLSALTSSVNIVSLKALFDVGFEPIIEVSNRMGIESELFPDYALALGASEVNLLELTGAYNTLANQGKFIQPHGIRRVLNAKGDVIFDAKSLRSEEAVSPYTASVMTWMLEQVVQSGTGRPARLNRPVAGKTGTSEQARDLWFVGYIPQLTTGVWLGNDDNQPTRGGSGTAAYLWGLIMKQLTADLPVEDFPELPDLNQRIAYIEAQPLDVKYKSGSVASRGEAYESASPSSSRQAATAASSDSDSPWSGGDSSSSGRQSDYAAGSSDYNSASPNWDGPSPDSATDEGQAEWPLPELNTQTADGTDDWSEPPYADPGLNDLPPPEPETVYELPPETYTPPSVEDALPPPEPAVGNDSAASE
ncbi:MAG: penicillin-binding transpeptidase domain-containing protein, partial [Cyanobacteria bacterium P01_H01_bin.121]